MPVLSDNCCWVSPLASNNRGSWQIPILFRMTTPTLDFFVHYTTRGLVHQIASGGVLIVDTTALAKLIADVIVAKELDVNQINTKEDILNLVHECSLATSPAD